MTDALTQLMAGGALAVIILREVFGYLNARKRNGNVTAGERSVEYWQQEARGIAEKALEDQLTPLVEKVEHLTAELDHVQRTHLMAITTSLTAITASLASMTALLQVLVERRWEPRQR